MEGYLKSYVSRNTEELFFWDSAYLPKFISKMVNQIQVEVPGMHFYSKLRAFGDIHLERVDSRACDFCMSNPWHGIEKHPIPELFHIICT